MRLSAVPFLFSLQFLLAACAPMEWRELRDTGTGERVPQSAFVRNVPVYEQEPQLCGPSSLRMVLEWSGEKVELPVLRSEVFSDARDGSMVHDLVAAARRHGKLSYFLSPSLRAVFTELAENRPVIVLQNLGLDWMPRWHLSVAVGYDLPNGEIVLHDGSASPATISLTAFENTFSRGGHVALIATDPAKIPDTASRAKVLEALGALDRIGTRVAAKRGYEAALNRWPRDPAFSLALANLLTEYSAVEAEPILRSAVEAHPRHQALLNNYALLLAKLHRFAEAERFAGRAVEVDGPFQAHARRTLSEIRQLTATAAAVGETPP